jgi:osmotically-inducible protein OsmY
LSAPPESTGLHGTEEWRPALSDITLRQDVMDELEFEPSLDAAHIAIIVENGIVTLTGHVKTSWKS